MHRTKLIEHSEGNVNARSRELYVWKWLNYDAYARTGQDFLYTKKK